MKQDRVSNFGYQTSMGRDLNWKFNKNEDRFKGVIHNLISANG
jgi:hypothetical protein